MQQAILFGLTFKSLPRWADAVTGHVSIVSKQLVITLNDSPWRYSNADQPTRSLLPLHPQSVANLLRNTWFDQENVLSMKYLSDRLHHRLKYPYSFRRWKSMLL